MDRRTSCLLVLCFLACAGTGMASVKAKLEGQVIAAGTGESLLGAGVELWRDGSSVQNVQADAEGRFSIPAVEPGPYELRVLLEGYFPIQQDIVLAPRDSLLLTVELHLRSSHSEQVDVRAFAPDIDPQRTGSARMLTAESLGTLPSPITQDVPALVRNLAPGAVLGHDNFIHMRGNELSLHQFVNGVSFLDNPHQHFTPGLSPQIFETVNFIAGGFPAEFGNRFGGILDITTRSGRTLNGRGRAALSLGTVSHRDGLVDYGGSSGRLGYYFYGGAFSSDRFLNPPTRDELHDNGHGGRGVAQLDYQGESNLWKLLITGGATRFELPHTTEEEELGRDAPRRLDSQTAILTWQHIVSPRTLVSTAVYERTVSDRLQPTTDPVTTFADGSRSTLTAGVKTDWYHSFRGHRLKSGVDLSFIRLRESFHFDSREFFEEELHQGLPLFESAGPLRARSEPVDTSPVDRSLDRPFSSSGGAPEAVSFRGRETSQIFGAYFQDRFSPVPNLTLDLGIRFDHVNILDSESEVSPRVGLAYHFPKPGTVVRFAYNRLFTPPPIEYVLLAGFLGSHSSEGGETVGNVKPYEQNYFEVGWSQRLRPTVFLDVAAYRHTGRNAFETSEISNTRLFLPTNFDRARARGLEITAEHRPADGMGLNARFQYALAKVEFVGPVSGGFAGEELEPGEEIPPAFDQRHTMTSNVFFRHPWRNFQAGVVLRYGSGTPVEEAVEVGGEELEQVVYLPDHWTADISARINLWRKDGRALDFELNVTNLTNRIYRVAKESEATPVQFAPRRVILGQVQWSF
ncbi:MAG: TonB-dependent receptor domain-containing protein [Acidobacteriota bacterium]